MFSKKATKIDEVFTVDLTLCSKRQINGEDFPNFRGLLRKYELYKTQILYVDTNLTNGRVNLIETRLNRLSVF